ncbi:hypothetical protein Taro_055422 [Colocasia esculenta]|uniref:Uncharacterized protein n=1 Tax=Colocasia esculenta TaxID=4460 RepID=A0A843XTJ0_COLES|nr:hypothetical protein [Colocasia esculenta]
MAEVRFPQNCVVLVSGYCCAALKAEVHRLVALCSGEDCSMLVSAIAVLPQSLRCAVGLAGAFWRLFPERCLGGSCGGSPHSCFALFRLSLLSLGGDELLSLPVGLSALQSAWAFPVKALCAWPCVWLLRWPACLVVRFQVFLVMLVDFVCPRGSGGLLHFLASRMLVQMVVW